MKRRRTSTKAQATGKTFDFTSPVETLTGEAKRIYYLLRRAAILAGDASALPQGKVYSEQQVIDILGEDYAASLSVPKDRCC